MLPDPFFCSYQYDSAGREVATWRDEQASKGEYFKYLPNGQLEKAYYDASQVSTGTPSGESGKTDYIYTPDRLNRQSVTENGVVTNYSYGVNSMNQITVWGGQNATYDGNFNFASMGGWDYSYDAESRLTGLDTGPTPRARFVYDGLGRCVKRTVGGVTTVINYDDWKPIMEWDSPTHWVAWNLYGAGPDEILWRHQAGVAQVRYHHDMHGNVTALLNYAGTVVERYTYDAFGRPTIVSASNTQLSTSAYGNRFMFQGREYFPELGLYDYRHRFYDPWMGRFLQTDPTGFDAGDMNLFRYCGDDPVDGSDPTGLTAINTSPDYLWSRLMWGQGNSPFGFNELFQKYVDRAAGMDGGRGGGGGGREAGAVFAYSQKSETSGSQKSLHDRAIDVFAEETANADVSQTAVVTAGPPFRVGPVPAKMVLVDPNNIGRGYKDQSLEEIRFTAPKKQKDIILHYHSYGWGKYGQPTEDHDIKLSRSSPRTPIYFTNKNWAREGKYIIIRNGHESNPLYDSRIIP